MTPPPRFERLSPEKREQILRTAGQKFAEHGYEGSTIQVILRELGLSAGAAYYYFDNKADLFTKVVRFYIGRLLEPAPKEWSIRDPESFWAAFLGSLEIALSQKYDDHKTVASLRRAWMMSRELRDCPEISQEFGRNENQLRQLVALGQKVGAIRIDLPAELLIRCVLALNDAFDDWMTEMPPETATKEVMHAIAAFRRFLEPQLAAS